MISFTPPLLSVAVLLLLSSTIPSVYSFTFFSPPTATKATSTTDLSKIPIVICPGFGNDEIDYYNPLNQGEEFGFVNALVRRGFNPELIQVLPLKRYEWIRVAGGLFDLNFYTFTCKPEGLGYGWYIKRLRQTIEELYQRVRSIFQDMLLYVCLTHLLNTCFLFCILEWWGGKMSRYWTFRRGLALKSCVGRWLMGLGCNQQ